MDISYEAIIKTLLYSDIFDFPLKREEIWKFLIAKEPLKKTEVYAQLRKIKKRRSLYYLNGRDELVGLRIKREKESVLKFKKAHKTIKLLSKIPTIKFIGISGSLALSNSEESEDIDLFVITEKNTVWISRMLLIIILKILGSHRKRGKKNVRDKFCLNMIIDENKLAFGKERQDLFTAHEIIQLMPIFRKNKTYERFVQKNDWILKFLPNTSIPRPTKENKKRPKLLIRVLRFFEVPAREVQLLLMLSNVTNETISNNFLAFHPNDQKEAILRQYNKKIRLFWTKNEASFVKSTY